MSAPLVSVIIPVYKVPEEYLRKCIESIIGQTLKEIEIILVDDGSPDNCGAICDEYAAKDERVNVIHKENGGVSSARNAGLKLVNKNSLYVAFIDSDDWVDLDYLSTLYHSGIDNGLDLVQCNHYYVKKQLVELRGDIPNEVIENENIKRLSYNLISTDYSKRYENKYYGAIRGVWGKLIKFEPIDREKIRFDEDMTIGEDAIFLLRLIRHIHRIGFSNNYLYYYRITDQSAINRPRIDMFESRLLLTKRYCEIFADDNSIDYGTCYVRNILSLIYHSVSCIIDCENNYRKKIEFIKDTLSNDYVRKIGILKFDVHFFNFKERLLIKLIKRNRYSFLYFAVKCIHRRK